MDIDREISIRTNDYLEERFREPKGPFNVEITVCGRGELWNVREIEDYQEAVCEAQILEDHGFQWRILGAEGAEYRPNLKTRVRRAA